MIPTLVLAASVLLAHVNGFSPAFVTTPKRTTRTALAAAAGSNANEIIPLKEGATCAIVTPMTSTGAVDVPALRTLLRFHVKEGTDGLCILGTTGEASTLSMDERATVLKTAVEEVKGKIPILVGTGTINPNHVKDMTLQAIDIGCDASLVVTPYYVKPPQRCLIKHFTTMADLGLPVVMYNIPGRAMVDFIPENMAICAQHENIVGVKDATAKVERAEEMRKLFGEDFLLYSGDDKTGPEFVMRGGDGCISVTGNVAPKAMHELMLAALHGEKDEVDQINAPLQLLHSNLFCESNPIPAKWALYRMGLINSPHCRPPLDELDPKFYFDVERALMAAGLIEQKTPGKKTPEFV